MKFDKKDLKILEILDSNARERISSIAKKCLISRQVAMYRINKLLSQKSIYGFYTLIDVGKLGYSSFRLHIRLKESNEKKYREFARNIFSNYPCFWVGFVSGYFDIIIDIFARNQNDFEEIFSKMLKENKNVIASYEILPIVKMDLYGYNYFSASKYRTWCRTLHINTGEYRLSKSDTIILKEIKFNARYEYIKIAKKLGMARVTVKNRIKELEKKGIIAGYKIFINFSHFNRNSYKIFIKYDTSRIEERVELMGYLKGMPGVLATLEFIGRWDLDIEIHMENAKELQKFLINLRNKFSIIRDYEIVQILEDYGIDFFPEPIWQNFLTPANK